MIQDKRLDKIQKSLTAKQAVILWLQEIQPIQNVYELIQYLKARPESEAPITKLTERINKAVREAMKGQPKEVIEPAVRRAVRDVVFLIKLQHQVNYKVMTDIRAWTLSQAAIAEALDNMRREIYFREIIVDIAERVNFEFPYPLEPETAKAVDMALRHHVHTFEDIVAEGYIRDWLWDYLISQGAKELPISASSFIDGKNLPTVTPENEAEIRACFKDESEFELFRSGQDYTCDLANVTDAEYNQHYQTMVNGIKERADSGQVEKGQTVHLDTLPIPFLQDVPLIDGKWLDRHILELAEWGVLLQVSGYQLKEEDQPWMASSRFVQANGKEVSITVLQELRQKAFRHVMKFPGRIKQIEGHPFIHFEDYCKWTSRKVKGDLQTNVMDGIITTSWNKWIYNHDNKQVAVAGIPVGFLHCSVDQFSYYSCHGEVREHLLKRVQFQESLRTWRIKPERRDKLVQDWKQTVNTCLGELYTFQQAVDSISNNYFEGCQILFPDYLRDLTEIITYYEKNVQSFNDSLAKVMLLCKPINLEEMRQAASKAVTNEMTYIIDMAKCEALDCLGDRDAGIKLAEKYL